MGRGGREGMVEGASRMVDGAGGADAVVRMMVVKGWKFRGRRKERSRVSRLVGRGGTGPCLVWLGLVFSEVLFGYSGAGGGI